MGSPLHALRNMRVDRPLLKGSPNVAHAGGMHCHMFSVRQCLEVGLCCHACYKVGSGKHLGVYHLERMMFQLYCTLIEL